MSANDWADYDIEDFVLAGRRARKFITRTARDYPYVLLGTAFGLGFVLGGGLRSRTGRALFFTGARLVLPQVEAIAIAAVRSMTLPEDGLTEAPSARSEG
ncbi:MAG: hypothetical protein H7Z43_08595 [Clostridia bacterium]|nr:hypothetical protein [Deltaproteobacteria bacterium]